MQKSNLGKINLGKIQYFIDQKSINITDKINLNLLKKTKIINKKSFKLKVLGSGEVKQKINIEADFFSTLGTVHGASGSRLHFHLKHNKWHLISRKMGYWLPHRTQVLIYFH